MEAKCEAVLYFDLLARGRSDDPTLLTAFNQSQPGPGCAWKAEFGSPKMVNYSAQTRAVTAIASSSKGAAAYPTVKHSKRYRRRKGRIPPNLSYWATCTSSCTMSGRSRQQSDRMKIP